MEDPEQLRDDLPFEEWVRYVFDHEDPDWHFTADGPFWSEEGNFALALAHQRRLFGAPEFLLDRYSPNQIG